MSVQKIRLILPVALSLIILLAWGTLQAARPQQFIAQARPGAPEPIPAQTAAQGQPAYLNDAFDSFELAQADGSQATLLDSPAQLIGALSTVSATMVSPADFHQAANSASTSSPASGFRFWPEGGYIYNTTATTMTLIAPITLPDGATLTKFSMVLFDNDAGDVTAVLYRKNIATTLVGGPAVEEIIAVGTAINDPQKVFLVFNSTFSGATTVSQDYSYYIVFQLAPNAALNQLVLGFSVEYTGGAASGTQVVAMPAFRHNGNNADGSRFDFNSGFVRNNSAGQLCLTAPVYPPVASTLTQLRASIFDGHDTNNLTVDLQRLELATGTATVLATVASNGTSGSPTNGELASAAISSVVSSSYSYYISTCFEAGTGLSIGLFGARVFFAGP